MTWPHYLTRLTGHLGSAFSPGTDPRRKRLHLEQARLIALELVCRLADELAAAEERAGRRVA